MFNKIHFLICVLLFSFFFRGIAQSQFSLHVDNGNYDHLMETQNGDLMISMDVNTNFSWGDHTIARFNRYGEELWAYHYDVATNSINATGHEMYEAPDGAIYVNMYLDSAVAKNGLLRLRADGSLDWARASGSSFREAFACNDGGVIMGGFNGLSAIATKMDSSANVIWIKNYNVGYPGNTIVTKILEHDSGYYMLGQARTTNTTNGLYDIFLLKVDYQGNPLWGKTYGFPGTYETCEEAIILSDGSIMMQASLIDSGGNKSLGLARLDTVGTVLWWDFYPYTGVVEGLALTVNETAVLSIRNSSGFGSYLVFVELDTSGTILQAPSSSEGTGMVIPTSDGDFAFFGAGSFTGPNPGEFSLSRSKVLGETRCQVPQAFPLNSVPYPISESVVVPVVSSQSGSFSTPVVPWVPSSLVSTLICDSCTVEADFVFQATGGQVSFSDISAGAVGAWHWNFGDGGTDSVSNPAHSYATSGQYQVCLTAMEGRCVDTVCYTVNVNLVGMPESATALNYWPNPTTGLLHLKSSQDIGKVEVTDLAGRSFAIENCQIGKERILDLEALSSGLYLLRIEMGSEVHSIKVMLQPD